MIILPKMEISDQDTPTLMPTPMINLVATDLLKAGRSFTFTAPNRFTVEFLGIDTMPINDGYVIDCTNNNILVSTEVQKIEPGLLPPKTVQAIRVEICRLLEEGNEENLIVDYSTGRIVQTITRDVVEYEGVCQILAGMTNELCPTRWQAMLNVENNRAASRTQTEAETLH